MRLRTLWLPVIILALAGCGNEDVNLPETPQLLVDRTAMQFDTEYNSGTYVGTSSFNTLYIESRGIQALEISDITLSGASEFTLKLPETWVQGQPLKLETYARTFVEVTFKPNAVKTYEGKLTIKSNAANQPTQEITLTGKGIAK